ncbi:MAG: ATP-binding protein [Phycisphaerae bacterium]|nr:ATP-binding protein [Phycisphaerae bacterium]
MTTPDYEKLGVFYLGKIFDPEARARSQTPLLYDSKDLVTHAVCVGMTGSGKTGLCIGLIEEAAIDGIPAIVIDPKGDLANLLLTFPDLKPSDFRPWINEEDARRKEQSPDDFAAAQAALWTSGLADWQQDGSRIGRLRASADFAVYTPGSSAGLPVSVLRNFAAPPKEITEDAELFRERVSGTVASLLGLLNLSADPLQSREHILLSAIFGDAWARNRDLDIPALIAAIQRPPFTRLGVMELESVFPAADRFGLAMALNNLVAAPGFTAWTEGDPLDIGAMLFTPSGRPRVSIFSIAHLSDPQRMFFVSLLLNQVLGWTRTQSGTSSLRALVYMDEIAGYFPPVANPPSKPPLLTLMKQARAFGVGLVLATQNPVDLDYKGLANAGTWFIGRLQTDQDKQRVLDGLEGAAAASGSSLDRTAMDRLLSGLAPRVFLMKNIHEDRPEVFETRWCLSYLRGPMSRAQLRSLTDRRRAADSLTQAAPTPAAQSGARLDRPPASPPRSRGTPAASSRPVLPPEIPQYFIPARAGGALTLAPMLLGVARAYYADAKSGIDQEINASFLTPLTDGPVTADFDHARSVELTDADLESDPPPDAEFDPLPPEAGKPRRYDEWKKSFAELVFRRHKLEALRSDELNVTSKPGECERDFRARLALASRERRDAAVAKLRQKLAPKIAALQDRARRAEQRVEIEREQSRGSMMGTAVSIGSAVLGAFMGRKAVSASSISRTATAIKGVGRSAKEQSDVGRAEENLLALRQQLAELETQFQREADAIAAASDATAEELTSISLKPKKTNISVRLCALAWAPHTPDGEPAW